MMRVWGKEDRTMTKRNELIYEPTPEEIALETAKIKAGWKDKTRRTRGGSREKKDKDYVPMVGRFCHGVGGGGVMEMVEGLSTEVE